jgi:hypothetical protein
MAEQKAKPDVKAKAPTALTLEKKLNSFIKLTNENMKIIEDIIREFKTTYNTNIEQTTIYFEKLNDKIIKLSDKIDVFDTLMVAKAKKTQKQN